MIFENNIIKYDLEPVDKGLGEMCFNSMKTFKNNVAQYIYDTNEEDTYSSLLQRSIRCALKMKSKGLKEGDVISICSYSHKNTCVPFLSAIFLGIKIAPLDPAIPVKDTAHLIKEVGPKAIFVSNDAVDLIEKSINLVQPNYKINTVVFGSSELYEGFDEYLVPDDKEEDFRPVPTKSLNDTAVILFSSGTTGLAKGICLPSRTCTTRPFALLKLMGVDVKGQQLKEGTNSNRGAAFVALCYTNIYWSTHVMFLLSSVFFGFSRVIAKEFDAAIFWKLIDKYKVNTILINPHQAIDICKARKPEGISTNSVRALQITGAATPIPVLRKLRQLFPTTLVSKTYGQTEVLGPVTIFNPHNEEDRKLLAQNIESVGRPYPGSWYKVADIETGQPLGPNQQGELCLKTDYGINGYYNRDSTEIFDNEGYMKTGDIVYYDKDFCFYFVDRMKHFLKYKGNHVAAGLIEEVLQEHPAVREAVVIGVPHEEDWEHALAIVQLNDNVKNISAEELIKFVDGRVDDTKKLRAGVKFIKEFPLTATGKVRRLDLKEMVRNGEL